MAYWLLCDEQKGGCGVTRPVKRETYMKGQRQHVLCKKCCNKRIGQIRTGISKYPEPGEDGKIHYPCITCGDDKAVGLSSYSRNQGKHTQCNICRAMRNGAKPRPEAKPKPDLEPYRALLLAHRRKPAPRNSIGCYAKKRTKTGHDWKCSECVTFDACLSHAARCGWDGWTRTGEIDRPADLDKQRQQEALYRDVEDTYSTFLRRL